MIFTPVSLQIDHSAYPVTGEKQPLFSWGAVHEQPEQYQTALRLTVAAGDAPVWDTGWVETREQQLRYGGPSLASGTEYRWTVQLRDKDGAESEEAEASFTTGLYEDWAAPFIAAAEDKEQQAPYFRKEFGVKDGLCSAVLFCCGIGYQKVTVNGFRAEDAELQPAHSDYSRRCYYTVTDLTGLLQPGENCIGVIVGEGWRRNNGPYVKHMGGRIPTFFGQPMLSAQLVLRYEDGSEEVVYTDESWQYAYGAFIMNNLFDGEHYDAGLEKDGFDLPGYAAAANGFAPAKRVEAPAKRMCVQDIPPIRVKKQYKPISITMPKPGCYILDFGQNIAGVLRLWIPGCMEAGDEILVRHAEELDENDLLFTDILRGAKAEVRYIADGTGREGWYQPSFTYHGFRYASVEGYPGLLTEEDVCALAFYTDLDNGSSFECGSPTINAIQKMVVQTERANLHSIATDCPQRDERMGWMNDATVRFEETPYNFDTGRMFPKILRDFRDIQSAEGAITCTAPWVFGNQPADPVSSSYLVLGKEALLFFDDKELVEEYYPGFAAWNEYLASRCGEDGIVDYTYYGDWAGPAISCRSMEDPCSSSTPGLYMSTGYHYYNSVLLSQFAKVLGKEDEAEKWAAAAEKTRKAILDKWWNPDTCEMATGSQACQAFALWLGILPEDQAVRAAKRMHDMVVEADYRITTGNLCTRYLMDMLAKYGYIEDAYALLMREEYPSWGFMLQNAATTVWERFELKKNGGMNSHNHPMYGAVGYWFYAYLAGIAPTEFGWKKFRVAPLMPKKLQYVKAVVETCRGRILVKWHKKYGEVYLSVEVPFGCEAVVTLPEGDRQVGSGYHVFKWEGEPDPLMGI